MIRIAIAGLLVSLIGARPAEACSPITYDPHYLDPAHASDHTAPSVPIASGHVFRDTANGGCDPCGDLTAIVITASAIDDRTPVEQIGFSMTVVRGVAPFAMIGPLRPQYADEMRVLFDADVHGYSFDLEIRAVDLNGNVGPPVVITIDDPPTDGGCTVQPAGSALSFLLAFLALGLAQRRRP